MQDLRVGSVQFQHVPNDKSENLKTMRHFIEEAASRNVQLLVFPEMCITGYWHVRNLSRDEIAALSESVPSGRSSQCVVQWAKEFGMSIGAGLIEDGGNGDYYNSYLVAMPDGKTACHRKIHAFENDAISCGSEFTVFDTPHGCRVGVLICYDNNIVENARITALMGAEILLAPHQTGGCDSCSPRAMGLIDVELWRKRAQNPAAVEAEFCGPKGRGWLMRWLPSRAHDNGMFLVFSNGVGEDDGEVRTGNAMILDPYGEVLAETCRAGNDMVIADLSPDMRDMCTGKRWIKARRPELYGPLAVATGQEEPTRKVRFGRS